MTQAQGTPQSTSTASTTSGPPSNQPPTSATTGTAPSAAPTPAPAPSGGGGGGGGGSSGSSTNPPNLPVFKPLKPNLGGLEQYDVGKFIPFTGLNGKAPNATRTALADGSDPERVYDNQFRPLGSSSQKSRKYRVTHTDDPITKKVKIIKFKKDFFQRGVEFGYDSIFWLKDSAGDMINVVLDSDHFDSDSAEAA